MGLRSHKTHRSFQPFPTEKQAPLLRDARGSPRSPPPRLLEIRGSPSCMPQMGKVRLQEQPLQLPEVAP